MSLHRFGPLGKLVWLIKLNRHTSVPYAVISSMLRTSTLKNVAPLPFLSSFSGSSPTKIPGAVGLVLCFRKAISDEWKVHCNNHLINAWKPWCSLQQTQVSADPQQQGLQVVGPTNLYLICSHSDNKSSEHSG